MLTRVELDAIDLAMKRNRCFQYQSQFEALKAIITRGGDSDVCMELYKNEDRFQEPCTDEQRCELLLLAADNKYYHLMKLIVTSSRISVPNEALLLFRHAKNEVSKVLCEDRAQVVTPGLISFMLAAGVDGSADCDRFADYIRDEVKNNEPIVHKLSHLMEIYCQLKLSCGRPFPIILITEADYCMLESSHSLRDDMVCFVIFDLNTRMHRIIAQENVFEKFSLSSGVLWGAGEFGFYELVSLIYRDERVVSNFREFGDGSLFQYDRNNYLQDVFERYEKAIKALRSELIGNFNFDWVREEIQPSQDYVMTALKRKYPVAPIFLDDDLIQRVLVLAQARYFQAVRQYIFERAVVAEHPQNLRDLLYYLANSINTADGYDYLQFFVRQDFPSKEPFYKFMLDAGLSLREVTRYMPGHIKYGVASIIAQSKNREYLARFYDCSDFDLLKEIKHALVFRFHHLQNGVIGQAIRDSLVLSRPTLFLNIIRSNRDLTELKDTKTYQAVCEYYKNQIISADAKAELKRRVHTEGDVSLRDVALYLALAGDLLNDREDFIDVCAKHLLLENPSDHQKAELNAGLHLLSVAEHNALRGWLMSVSGDGRLKETLQARLPSKNCAFIEMIRTSAKDRAVKDTRSFKTWADALSMPTQVNTFKDEAKRKVFNLFARMKAPDPASGNVNVKGKETKKDEREDRIFNL